MATMIRPVPKEAVFVGGRTQHATATAPQQRVVGVHTGHNSGAVLVEDGVLKMAIQEERLTRIKNQGGFPTKAMQEIIAASGPDHHFGTGFHLALGGKNLSECYWRREDILRSEGSGATRLNSRGKDTARKKETVTQ